MEDFESTKKYIHDGIGYVQLVDKLGSDITVVNAARISMGKQAGKSMTIADERLIAYLAKHGHISPFFHPQIQIRVKIPIFILRQLQKSQVGCSFNEISKRYNDEDPDFYMPIHLRQRDKSIKQGSKEEAVEANEVLMQKIRDYNKQSIVFYNELLDSGVAPEQARIILGQNAYTSIYMTGSLSYFSRVCKLRMAPDSQREIQEFASVINDIMAEEFPISWKYLMNPDFDPPKRIEQPKVESPKKED